MIISVASGKGGTGKTTVATNLALALDSEVQLLDCDVEEPNAHLFVQPSLDHRVAVSAPVPEIDPDRCTRCGQCEQICQFKAIAVLSEAGVLTFPELCHSCGGCWAVCPENAITQERRELGEVETGRRNGLFFAHGRLRVGEAMAPPVIRSVRSFARADRPTIIDAPPGTSCPVIAAMKDTDVVLLVTEPTPFGLHDLKLAVGAVRVLDIPCALVINRQGVGDDRVLQYARQEELPVLMEIPFDRRIAEIYSRGQVLVEALPEWRPRFRALFEKLKASATSREAVLQ